MKIKNTQQLKENIPKIFLIFHTKNINAFSCKACTYISQTNLLIYKKDKAILKQAKLLFIIKKKYKITCTIKKCNHD